MANSRVINTILKLKNEMTKPLESIKKQIASTSESMNEAKQVLDRHKAAQRLNVAELKRAREALAAAKVQYGENSKEVKSAEGAIRKYKDAVALNRENIKKTQEQYKSLRGELGKLKTRYKETTKLVGTLKDKFNQSISSMIKKVAILTAATAGIVIGVGFSGIKELDEGTRKVKSIAGASLQMKDIQKGILDASLKTGVSMKELTETQYSAISAGIKASDSLMASVKAAQLAKAGFTDSNSALKLMASTMNVFGMTGDKALSSLSDKFMMTQNLGVTTVAELSSSMGSLTPIAKAAGLSIDEILGGMATLTSLGSSTGEASTQLKAMMSAIIKPSSQASKLAKTLGIDFSTTALKSKGLAGFMQTLKEKTGGNTQEMATLMGGTEALNAALNLISDSGMKKFKEDTEAMANSAGTTDKAYQLMQGSISNQIDKLKNTFKVLSTEVLNSQSGMISEQLSALNEWVSNNKETIQGFVAAIGDGIGNAIKIIGDVFAFIKDNSTVVEVIGTFIAVVYGIMKAIELYNGVMAIAEVLTVAFSAPLLIIVGVIAAVSIAIVELIKHWDTVVSKLKAGWKYVKAFFGGGDNPTPTPNTSSLDNTKDSINKQKKINGLTETTITIAEVPKVDIPKVEIPSAEVPKVDIPKVEIPSAEVPKVDIPKVEIPSSSVENNSPITTKQYAIGGVATSPSIFGEAGPEIAIPLNNSSRSKSLLSKADSVVNNGSNGKSSKVFNFYGDFYGLDDFKEKVMGILNDEADEANLNLA